MREKVFSNKVLITSAIIIFIVIIIGACLINQKISYENKQYFEKEMKDTDCQFVSKRIGVEIPQDVKVVRSTFAGTNAYNYYFIKMKASVVSEDKLISELENNKEYRVGSPAFIYPRFIDWSGINKIDIEKMFIKTDSKDGAVQTVSFVIFMKQQDGYRDIFIETR